ncbi:hypothetical protein ACIO8H_35560 [Streptomyces sp. NPDC087226]|uniref:hypothetical protein n=1 Tax=Streptomyces sp. NPDC087226 TaxID=3365771 RepID=UPI003804E71C
MSLFSSAAGGSRRSAGRRASARRDDGLRLDGGDGVYVVHRGGGAPALPGGTEESLREAAPGQVTVLVATRLDDTEIDEAVALLAPVVNGLRETDRPLWLAMSGAARRGGGDVAPAQLFSDRLALDVLAPAGPAVVVPGGTLFTPDGPADPEPGAGWWRFAPAGPPRYAGLRVPVPAWEASLSRIQPDLVEGHVVETVPAGLLIRPAGAPAQRADALGHAVPVHADVPVLVVGVPGAARVDAEAVETVLAALPGRVRDIVMLLPGDGGDLVPVAQETADALGLALHVGNGVPLFLDGATLAREPSTTLVDTRGTPSWQPYVTSVVCAPARGDAAAPRPSAWRAPTAWASTPEPGVLDLGGRWQAVLTRAGLWVSRADWHADAPLARAPEPDVVAIELGVPGRGLDDSLWPRLERLFESLDADVRDRAIVRLHGNIGAEGLRTLRRLTVRYGLALAAKGPRTARATEAVPVAPARQEAPGNARSAQWEQPVPQTPAPPAASEDVDGPGLTPAPDREVGVPGGEWGADREVGVPGGEWGADPEADGAAEDPAAGAGGGEDGPGSAGFVPPAAPPRVVTSSSGAASHPARPASGYTPEDPAGPAGPADDAASRGAPAPSRAAAPGGEDPAVPPSRTPAAAISAHGPAHHAAPWQDGTPTGRPPSAPADADGAPPFEDPHLPPFPEDRAESGAGPAHDAAAPAPGPLPEAADDGSAEPPGPARPAADIDVPDQDGGVREVHDIPVTPSYRSGPEDRRLLRTTLGKGWEPLSSLVHRAFTRMPALRTADDAEGVTADLIAVCAHLGSPRASEGEELDERLSRRDPGALALVGCVASGLRRLPSYRGAALRTSGIFPDGYDLLPGEELGEAVPLSAQQVGAAYGQLSQDHFLIWSSTARRTDTLTGTPSAGGELLFAPGTRLRVLDTRQRGTARIVLLRELAEHDARAVPGRLNDIDRLVLDRLAAVADSPATKTPVPLTPRGTALGILAEDLVRTVPL